MTEAPAPGPVQNIQASVIPTPDGISANLTWDRPDNRTGHITSFLVRWGRCVKLSILSWIEETTANSTIVPGNLQHFLLTDLRPNSRYGVQVFSLTSYHSGNDLNINIAHVTCFETGDLPIYGTTKVTLSKMRTALLESTLPYGLPVGETLPPSTDASPLPLHIYIPASIAVTLLLFVVSYCYYRHYKFSSQGKKETKDETTPEKYLVSVDVTGFSPDEISVKTVGNKVRVQGKHEARHADQTGHSFRYQELRREFVLPEGVDPETVTSVLSKDGVLSIQAPRMAIEAPPAEKVVPVQSAEVPAVEKGTEDTGSAEGDDEMAE
ncbi:uncharacterized protein [Branchiostoma lanceolatum]|uniref:uncharacterized protein n=1 Tax=Branchiostoma lanceolatum TaxID=7740 RepID=UPI003455581E